MFDLGTDA
jgi:hypothetical protein